MLYPIDQFYIVFGMVYKDVLSSGWEQKPHCITSLK